MVTKTKEGRGANVGAGQSGTESAAAQAAPATRKKAAGGAAAGEAKGGARGGKSAASQNESDASPRKDDAIAETARDLPGSSAATMSSKKLLTEAEILKMSDKDYMNEAQLAFFKDRLVKMRDEILANANQTTEHLRETVIVPDPADRATIEEEHALELRTRDRERKLLKKVEQSIARIDANDYGYCDETGEPIGIPRLLARPTATLTLEAQERREKRQKLMGD
ncbi:RNA polymerase-binding transcription factor DksA [Ralstonia sp. LMG 32965]|jgi:DnaK suppressor protein|uniref:RNA polymerase-binding transcription factor DksA n=4 Tax=Ralstonia TaxID=48736 RepID=A0AAD2F6G8_9RALS|nr:RNA polymerase-binding transcription factor DksA [Ralstonia sp. LMG 32965]CAJ0886998.1 RNA polymerase-binding transcription factor DksA [Ralstonia sp. LMG 32965]